jgi:hypothetical protein
LESALARASVHPAPRSRTTGAQYFVFYDLYTADGLAHVEESESERRAKGEQKKSEKRERRESESKVKGERKEREKREKREGEGSERRAKGGGAGGEEESDSDKRAKWE